MQTRSEPLGRTWWRRMLGPPETPAGWQSIGLAGAFVTCFALSVALVAAGQRGGDSFFDNPLLAVTMLMAGTAAIAGGITAGVAIVRNRERSLLVVVVLLLGLLVSAFVLGEVFVPH